MIATENHLYIIQNKIYIFLKIQFEYIIIWCGNVFQTCISVYLENVRVVILYTTVSSGIMSSIVCERIDCRLLPPNIQPLWHSISGSTAFLFEKVILQIN